MRWRPALRWTSGGPVPLELVLAGGASRALASRRQMDGAGPVGHPGLVLGPAHGSAAHLALAMGMPWLPTGGPWREVADRHAAAGAPVIVVHGPAEVDGRFLAGAADWCRRRDRPFRQVVYADADALSAAVADLYRRWLREHGRTGNRLVVECGRLVDPWQVLRAGLVPYWCRDAGRRHVDRLAWWVAGSETFTSIDALPEPPGRSGAGPDAAAPLDSWRAVVSFGSRHREVDRRCARAYRSGTVPPAHATAALRGHPCDLPCLPQLTPDEALARVDPSAGVLIR